MELTEIEKKTIEDIRLYEAIKNEEAHCKINNGNLGALIDNEDVELTVRESIVMWVKDVCELVYKSKHFDLVKTLLISMVLALVSYQLPNVYFYLFGKENINADFAAMVQETSFAAFKFFVARLVVDASFYFNEYKFYVFLKRNGNIAFDYQENLIELTKWQQTIITTAKYVCYLFLFAFLLGS